MLSGEPPWKDQNLKGLIQLHLLLQNWEKGPPPYKSTAKITPEADECLRMCFMKDPEDRPRVTELLKCAFLVEDNDEDDDGEDDGDIVSYNNRGEPFKSKVGKSETLEDSGVISGLKQEMAKALSVSKGNSKPTSMKKPTDIQIRPQPQLQQLAPISNSDDSNYTGVTTRNKSEDTMAAIDRQIQARNSNKNNNKFAYPETPATPIYQQLEKPKFSADIILPAKSALYPPGNNFSSDSQGNPTNQSSRNPFSRGAVSLKSNSATSSPQVPHISTASPSTDRREGLPVEPFTPPVISTPRPHLDPIPIATNKAAEVHDNYNSNHNNGISDRDAKDKLALLKNRPTYRATRLAPSNNGNALDRHTSQSSNRDTEDLTPLAADTSDNEIDGRKQQVTTISNLYC